MLHVTGDFGWAVRKSPAACRLRCTHTRAAAQVVETRSTRSIVQTAAAAESLQGLDIVLSSDLKPLLPRCNLCCIAAHRLQRVTERVRVHWAALVLCCALWRALGTSVAREVRIPSSFLIGSFLKREKKGEGCRSAKPVTGAGETITRCQLPKHAKIELHHRG